MTSKYMIRNSVWLPSGPSPGGLIDSPDEGRGSRTRRHRHGHRPGRYRAARNQQLSDTTVTGGVVSLQTDDVHCIGSVSHPCSYVLNAVRISLSNFTFSGEAVTDAIVVVNGPLSVQDNGEGIIIPAGTPVVFAFTQGEAATAWTALRPRAWPYR